MKRLILILSVVLGSALSMSAQHHGRGTNKHHHNRESRVERMDKRVGNLTAKMVESYGLSDEQGKKLSVLNKEFYVNRREVGKYNSARKNYHHNRKDCHIADGVKYNHRQQMDRSKVREAYNEASMTPMLYKQYRINKLQAEVEAYQDGLKQIFTKKQYKEYQKRMEDSLKKMN